MTRLTRVPAMLAVLVSAGALLSACGGGGFPSDAVALVGSTPITKASFEHWMEVSAASTAPKGSTIRPPVAVPPDYTACIAYLRSVEPRPSPAKSKASEAALKASCAKEYSREKKTALDFLIMADAVIAQSAELGVRPSSKEIAQNFAETKKVDFHSEAAFTQYLAKTAYTRADLELKAEVEQLLPPKVETALINRARRAVSESVVERYYDAHKSTYQRREAAGLYLLLTSSEEKAKAAKVEIESGKSFATVAKEVSVVHTSQKGGDYLTTEQGFQEEALDAAIFPATQKKNILEGPVKTTAGYYLFEVKTVTPAHVESLSQATEKIKGALTVKSIEAELSGFKGTFRKRWRAKTICRPEYYFSSLCGKRE